MTMTDAEFLRAFEDCTLPGASFHHREHVRLAWLCVRESGEAGAETRIAEGIRRYAESLGATAKYHHTLTLFWVRVCASALRATPGLETFDAEQVGCTSAPLLAPLLAILVLRRRRR